MTDINGSNHSDLIIGSRKDDEIEGNDGNDLILSGSGDDVVNGGAGDDLILSGNGDDTVDGGSGNDLISGGNGDDTLSGGDDSDALFGGRGDDTLHGDDGDDALFGEQGDDILIGGRGSDLIDGNGGYDVAVFAGERSEYRIEQIGSACFRVTHLASGDQDLVVDVEQFRFDDGDIDPTDPPPENLAPVAVDDAAVTDENTAVTVDVLANDTDPDGDALTVSSASAANGTVVINADGSLTYTPDADFTGEDSILYTITDGNGGSSEASVAVTVNDTNALPVAVDDSASVQEEAGLSQIGNALLNDLAGDGTMIISMVNGDALNVGASVAGSNGGLFVMAADGSVSFDPDGQFAALNAGETATTSVTYTISDEDGDLSTATYTVTVEGQNPSTAPDAAIDSAVVSEDESSVVFENVLANDTDADGDSLSVSEVAGSSANVGQQIAGSQGGYWVLQSDGRAEFFTNGEFDFLAVGEETTETLQYKISDGRGGEDFSSVTVTITGANDAPVATDDLYEVREGEFFVALNIFTDNRLVQNDIDSDLNDTLRITEVNGQVMTGNSMTVTGSNGGEFLVYADGRARLSAETGFENLDQDEVLLTQISYTVSDSNGASSTATVTMQVNGENVAVIAYDDAVSTDDLTAVDLNVLANDQNGDAPAVVTEVNGSAAQVGAVIAGSSGGLFVIDADGNADFDPNGEFDYLQEGESATTSVTYTINDNDGQTSTATLTVTVDDAGNQVPVAVADSVSATEGANQLSLLNALVNDIRGDGASTVVAVAGGAGNVGAPAAGSNGGEFTIAADGSVIFDANGDFTYLQGGETAITTVTYTIADEDGDTSTAVYQVTVNGVANQAPRAVNDSGTINEDAPSLILSNVLLNDTDADQDELFVSAVARSATKVGEVVAGTNGGYWILEADGTAEFFTDGDFDYLGAGQQVTEQLQYTVSDGAGGSAFGNVSVVVTGANDAPVAVDDFYQVNEGSFRFALNILTDSRPVGNDTDADANAIIRVSAVNDVPMSGTSITVAGSEGGAFQIYADGRARFSAETGFDYLKAGETVITTAEYTITDGSGAFSTALIELEVTGVNDAVVAAADEAATDEATAVSIRVLENDTDLDGYALSILSFDDSSLTGSVVANADGSFTYDPAGQFDALAAGETATDTFTYTVSDGNGGTSMATVEVLINGTDNDFLAG
ncbi:Ig-like domain-containing protein [Allohahella marinimesophila]|uniref:Cadherin domain-containing protein n=1 Tax=Allohahella marinimesophila TaxID=1054972 RepID=A0ABP7NK43_9GAMM